MFFTVFGCSVSITETKYTRHIKYGYKNLHDIYKIYYFVKKIVCLAGGIWVE
jgi:hypothetical protein